jgi:hypothetical protein
MPLEREPSHPVRLQETKEGYAWRPTRFAGRLDFGCRTLANFKGAGFRFNPPIIPTDRVLSI